MKQVYNKDGSVDLHATWKELEGYWVGCAISGDNEKLVIRCRGVASDLKNMIFPNELYRIVQKKGKGR